MRDTAVSHYVFPCGGLEVLVDPEDAEVLMHRLASGWRLELRKNRRRDTCIPTLVLRGHGSIALARAVMNASESQHVIHKGGNGPLDCRRAYLQLQDAGRRIGWASKINGSGPAVDHG